MQRAGRNSASGSQMRGMRSFSPESSSAASARASRICEAAMEIRMVTAEPKVSHRAAATANVPGAESSSGHS